MTIKIVASVGDTAGRIWKNLQNTKTQTDDFSISAPLSSTPLPLYTWIVDNAHEFINWQRVKFVLMDEMLEEGRPWQYVTIEDQASYEGFARKNFLDPLSKKLDQQIEVIKPHLDTIEKFSTPLDLLILALGPNGNYANVMPGTSAETGWHIAHLTSAFRQSHTNSQSQSYNGANFREHGMSLGPQQLFEAKHIVVIISGSKKHELTKQLLSFKIFDPTFPLSIIYHPNIQNKVNIFITKDVGIA